MAQSSIKVYTCDRCKHTEEIRNASANYNWGKIAFMQENGSQNLSFGGKWPEFYSQGKDLCPTCLNELDNWYWQRKL